jgi:hypothetical protein
MVRFVLLLLVIGLAAPVVDWVAGNVGDNFFIAMVITGLFAGLVTIGREIIFFFRAFMERQEEDQEEVGSRMDRLRNPRTGKTMVLHHPR